LGGDGGVAGIEVDVDVLVSVCSSSPQGQNRDGGIARGGSALSVDSSEGNSEVLGQQWVGETSTVDLNLSVWRVGSSWANWSLPWRRTSDDWAISVSSRASHRLGLVGSNSVEEEVH